ncbi:MAG: hypothetical protein RSD71_05835 [Flavobacterium sp.]|uniref:hypothetical protein n=1 Tax=Flavobacterium sp. TaxID=239 RepID=UPI002FC7CD7A
MKQTITLLFLITTYLTNAQESNKIEIDLEKYFSKINEENIEYLIPYRNYESMFGWYDMRDGKFVTPAIFNEVDFETNKTLTFTYNSIEYNFSLPHKIEQVKWVRGFPSDDPIADDSLLGFHVENQTIDRYSSKFKKVRIINEKSDHKIGIATNLENMQGIIDEKGNIAAGFDFKFSEIDYFKNDKDEIYFITKKPSEKLYVIYSKDGKEVSMRPIIDYRLVSPYKLIKHGEYPFQTEKICVVTFPNYEDNILDENTFKFILSKGDYGISKVNVRELKINDKKVKKYICLAINNDGFYYVDELGIKYKYMIQ